jgi:hypothetical protein
MGAAWRCAQPNGGVGGFPRIQPIERQLCARQRSLGAGRCLWQWGVLAGREVAVLAAHIDHHFRVTGRHRSLAHTGWLVAAVPTSATPGQRVDGNPSRNAKKNPAIRIAGFSGCINQEEGIDTVGDTTYNSYVGVAGTVSSTCYAAPNTPIIVAAPCIWLTLPCGPSRP